MLVRHRILLSAGLSAAAGIILRSLVFFQLAIPFFTTWHSNDRISIALCLELHHISVHDAMPCPVDVLLARHIQVNGGDGRYEPRLLVSRVEPPISWATTCT
jgi:hypothetical protein